MTTKTPPASTDEVRQLVIEARSTGRAIRIRGAAHSVDEAIEPSDHHRDLLIQLHQLRSVIITPEDGGAVVEVGAGCNLGYDRYDPTGTSTWENSLTHQLDQRGFALDCLGGISHQTVGGFMLTGSAGGSLVHDLGSNIIALELVDGRGEVHYVKRDDPDPAKRDLFEAAGVSMGLLGIITRVWFRATERYDVRGREVTYPLKACPIDLFGEQGRAGLADLFRRDEYCRVLWWPQPGFDRLQIWSGARSPLMDGDAQPFEILGRWDNLFGSLLQTIVGNVDDLSLVPERLRDMEWYARLERTLIGISRSELLHRPAEAEPTVRGISPRQAAAIRRAAEVVLAGPLRNGAVNGLGKLLARRMPQWVGPLTSLFVEDGEKTFHDAWHLTLPMDNQLDDKLWPTVFSEMWLPLDRADEIMRAVRGVVEAGGDVVERDRRVRAFPLEMYPGPKSSFWLSPGYQREALRMNVARFTQWSGEPDRKTIDLFLDALRPFDPRPHWGKFLPSTPGAWASDFHRQLPRLPDFLQLRSQLDPDGLFLSDYWRAHLGISCSAPRVRPS